MLQNPSNLFSGGQGLLRSPRITDFVAQREAKKRAREEALNDYFIKLPSTINAAGVRQQDLMNPRTGQGILSKINDWTQRGMQNLDQIKANPQAYSQHMAELNQIKNDIAYSKGLGKSQLEFNKERAEKGWDFDDNDIQTLSKMEQSMYDKEHYREDGLPYGFGDLSGAISAYTPQMGNQTDKLVTGDFKPEYDPASRAVRLDPTGKVIVTKAYSPKAIQNMGERMEAIASTNKSVNRHYSKMMDNPEQIEKATVALQKVYGQFDADGNEIIADTPEKLAKGLTIADKTNFKKDELVRDEALAQQYKKKMADYNFEIWRKKNGITFGQRKQMAQQQHEYQKAMKFGYGNEWLDNEWKNLTENPVGTISYTKADGTKENVKLLGVTSGYKKAFESQGYEPDDVIMYPNGDVSGIIYQRDEKTGVIKKSETGNRPIVQSVIPVRLNKEQAKIAYGKSITSGKDLTEELSPAEQKVLEEKQKEKSVKKQKLSW